MKHKVVDFHCDALSKMQLDSNLAFDIEDHLDVTLQRMRQGGVALQTFAIFVSEKLGKPNFGHILDQIDIFQHKVVSTGVIPITSVEELEHAWISGTPGGLLSIEGADGLEGNLFYLETCFKRGVRFLGITWNYGNWAADGILEPRNGGLTPAGRKLVQSCYDLGITLDVSHLSEQGFWDLTELANEANKPFIASHSNVFDICRHVRNLQEQQIQAIINIDGLIGLTYVPWFVKNGDDSSSYDLLHHIERICELGGQKHLMFGSDFDGIESHLTDLKHAGHYENWVNTLLKYYPEELVIGWISGNALSFLKNTLPERR
ncbi:Membrane dipeptidase [compost metagenome]